MNFIKFSYNFKNNRPGSADGVITLSGFGKFTDPNATVTFYWGMDFSGGVMPLPDYTPIATISAGLAADGYVIDKGLCIPRGAVAVLAEICGTECDGVATFTLPDEKLPAPNEKPLYTVGFASDFHLGGWGSERAPKEGLMKARDGFNRLADFLVTEGDLVQWHGCYSGEEFRKYNFNRETGKWGDNGERDPGFVETGLSQWDLLDEYLSGFTIPVYHSQGNHDIIDEEHWSPVCGNRDYFGEFLTRWIRQSEKDGKYETAIHRDERVHYYATSVKGHKFVFTEAPHPHPPHHTVGKEELEWLDRVLFDGEESGKPIFVMGHSPIDPRLNKKTAYADFTDLEEMRAVLDRHPTVIYVSGHSHFTLDTPLKNAIDGGQEKASHLHNGGMTTIIDPPPMTQYNVTHGTVAEVYGDRILIRGRDFTAERWISLAECEMIFKRPCEVTSLAIASEIADGEHTLLAKCDFEAVERYEWYLNGELISDRKSITIRSHTHGYIALRVRDKKGGFRSVLFPLD